MKHTIETGLDFQRSKKAIDKAMQDYTARFADYNPRYEWTSESTGEFGFSAKGIKLGGTIVVHEGKVEVDMSVPFVFRIFQGQAMKIIQEQVELWVERAKRGELD